MARNFAVALALVIVMSRAVSAQDVKTVLNNASKAMGAQNLKSIQFSGSGSTFAVGQALNPNVGWPRFNADSYTYTVDYESASARQEMVRSQALNPPLGGGAQPAIGHQRGIQYVSGNYAWAINGQDKVVTQAVQAHTERGIAFIRDRSQVHILLLPVAYYGKGDRLTNRRLEEQCHAG